MSKSLSRFAAIVATAAFAVTLSACTAGHWVYDSAPAAGVQTDVGGIKLRNMLILTDGSEATLIGGIASSAAAVEVQAMTITPETAEGTAGEERPIDYTAEIGQGKTVLLDGTESSFSGEGLTAGRLARLNVTFSNGENASLLIPVYSSEHEDFAEAWSAAQA